MTSVLGQLKPRLQCTYKVPKKKLKLRLVIKGSKRQDNSKNNVAAVYFESSLTRAGCWGFSLATRNVSHGYFERKQKKNRTKNTWTLLYNSPPTNHIIIPDNLKCQRQPCKLQQSKLMRHFYWSDKKMMGMLLNVVHCQVQKIV